MIFFDFIASSAPETNYNIKKQSNIRTESVTAGGEKL